MVHFVDASRLGDVIGWTLISYQQKVNFGAMFFHPSALLHSCAFYYFTLIPYLLFNFYCVCIGAY